MGFVSRKYLLAGLLLVFLLLAGVGRVVGQGEDEGDEANEVDTGGSNGNDSGSSFDGDDSGGGNSNAEEEGCPESEMDGMMNMMNTIVPAVPKCILGPNVINLQLRSPIEALPRINCVLKCVLAELGIFGEDGKFNIITAMEFFKKMRPEGRRPGGGGMGGSQMQECLLLTENFKPDEYECRSYASFFQCIMNTIMERMMPRMEGCMGGMLDGGGGGPMRGLMGLVSSLSPMGMLGSGSGGGLMSLLGGGGLRGLLDGNGLGQLLGGEAGGNLAGPLNGILSGLMRGAMSGGVNGLLAGDQGRGGGPLGNLLGGGLGGLLSGGGAVGAASSMTQLGAASTGLNLLSTMLQGQGNLIGGGLQGIMGGMMGRGGGLLGGRGLLRRRLMGRPTNANGTMGVRHNNRFMSRMQRMGGRNANIVGQSSARAKAATAPATVAKRQETQSPPSYILTQLHSNSTNSIVYQFDRVTNLARSLQLLTNNTAKL